MELNSSKGLGLRGHRFEPLPDKVSPSPSPVPGLVPRGTSGSSCRIWTTRVCLQVRLQQLLAKFLDDKVFF